MITYGTSGRGLYDIYNIDVDFQIPIIQTPSTASTTSTTLK